MKRLVLLAGLIAGATRAYADAPSWPVQYSPNDLVSPTSIVEGSGVKVGEGTVLHPIVGLESGFISNVFYEDQDPNASGLLRLLVEVQAGTLPASRLAIASEDATDPGLQSREAGGWQYDLRAYASYDQYLSTNDKVRDQGGLGGGLLFRGVIPPNAPLNFSYSEYYTRLIRATNFESSDATNRDINRLNLQLNYMPRGRTLGGYLYWQDVVDYFERDTQHFANRFQNTFGARVQWQWLPLTRLYLDTSWGVFTGLGDSTKVDSFPLAIIAGIQTSMTLNITLAARIGYTRGFYASGPDFNTVVAGLEAGFRYSPLGRITMMYGYDHADSINANFYRDHTIQATVEQLYVPFAFYIRPEIHFREYSGVTVPATSMNRSDTIGAVTVGARYMFRNWLAGTLDYEFVTDQTSFRYMTDGILDDPSYTRHQLLLGLRAAY